LLDGDFPALAFTWGARLLGLGLALLVVTLAVALTRSGDGPPNPFTQPPKVAMGLMLLPMMTLGLLIAWRWEVAGAALTLLAWAAFNVLVLVARGRLAGGAFPLFAVAAVLYLVAAGLRARRRPRPGAAG
jgi:hypothetical protein